MMSKEEWGESLKLGDEVAIKLRDGYKIGVITKMTKTMIVCGSQRFNKTSLQSIGDGYYRAFLEELTDELRYKIRANRISAILSILLQSGKIEDDVLHAMYDAYKKAVKKE